MRLMDKGLSQDFIFGNLPRINYNIFVDSSTNGVLLVAAVTNFLSTRGAIFHTLVLSLLEGNSCHIAVQAA